MSKPNVRIRKVTSADLQELQFLSRKTFYDSFADANTEENMNLYSEAAFTEKQLLDEINHPESAFYFALVGKDITGYLKLNTGKAQTDLPDMDNLELARIYVKKEFQGQLIGQKLLDKAIEIAKGMKKKYIWLGVWERNPGAIRFYERAGFKKFSIHPFMLGNDRQTDILMKLKL